MKLKLHVNPNFWSVVYVLAADSRSLDQRDEKYRKIALVLDQKRWGQVEVQLRVPVSEAGSLTIEFKKDSGPTVDVSL